MSRTFAMLSAAIVLLGLVGCGGGQSAVEGKVKIPSTDVFKHNKAIKSPPPKTPK